MRGYFTRIPKSYSIEEMPQIDNNETLKRFGYPATAISPSGTRKVVCKCERCGITLERIRIRVRPPVLCLSCTQTKHDRDDPATLVDTEETLKQFGYSVKDIPRSGNEKVVGICSSCKGLYHVRIKSVKTGMKCRPCLRTEICKTQWAPRENDGSKYLNDEETRKQFGYSAVSLSAKSQKKVVAKCSCGELYSRVRRNIDDSSTCNVCARDRCFPKDPIGLIDVDATLKEFGYTPDRLTRGSSKPVIGVCTQCKESFRIRLKSSGPDQVCKKCEHTRRVPNTYPLPPEFRIDDAETYKQCNYYATEVSPSSLLKVISSCETCGSPIVRCRKAFKVPVQCISCIQTQTQARLDHTQKALKGKQTMRERYPEGLPRTTNFGQTAQDLGVFLSTSLGRKLLEEKILSNGQRLDLFDPQTNIGIEYCGLYWHNEHSLTPRGRRYHADKMKAAQKDGYKLITVFEDEYLEREEAVKNRLLVILGNKKTVVQARKCQVILVDADTAKEFIEKHHIQGAPPPFKYAFGLAHEGELLGVMTGGVHHRQGHKDELVLSRLCFAPQVHVTGGSARLFKKLCDQGRSDGYKKITTWSDNRWTEGDVYSRFGMVVVSKIPPDYSYIKAAKPGKRFSKQSQQKRLTGCPPEITEREWAHQHGFSRIWDCGHLKWEFTL
jgi:hypothetical protein